MAAREGALVVLLSLAGFAAANVATTAIRQRRQVDLPRQPVRLAVVASGGLEATPLQAGPRPMLLYLFDPECQFSVRQMTAWREVARALRNEVHAVAISTSSIEEETMALIQLEVGVRYAGAGFAHQMQQQLGLRGTPTTALVSPSGRVVARIDGLRSATEILRRLRPQLDER